MRTAVWAFGALCMRDASALVQAFDALHLQLVAKLALWGLSRQELLLGFLTTRAGAVLRALLPSLTVDNRWQVRVLTCTQQTAARTPCGTPWTTLGSLSLQPCVKRPPRQLTAACAACGAVVRVHQVRRKHAGEAGGPLLAGHRGERRQLAAADGSAPAGGANEPSAPGVCGQTNLRLLC